MLEPLGEPTVEVVSALEAARAGFAEAYAGHNAEAMSALFHPDATFGGTLHPYWMEGKDTIQRLWTYYFASYPSARMVFWSSTMRTLAPGTVVVQYATATMVMPDNAGGIHNIHMRLTVVWVKVAEYPVGARTLQWQIAHMHGAEAPLFR